MHTVGSKGNSACNSGNIYLDQAPRLLFFFSSLHILVQLLFEGGYYSRAATIRGRSLFHWKADISDGWIRYVRAMRSDDC